MNRFSGKTDAVCGKTERGSPIEFKSRSPFVQVITIDLRNSETEWADLNPQSAFLQTGLMYTGYMYTVPVTCGPVPCVPVHCTGTQGTGPPVTGTGTKGTGTADC